MRCFIGVPLPGKVKKALADIQAELGKEDARMIFVKPENMHITLLFLGNVSDTSKIIESLSEVKFKKFNASVSGVSYFPKHDYIRVIHSPILSGKEELIAIYKKITAALQLNAEKYIPHITLARVKFVKSTNSLARACNSIQLNLSFLVNSINLYSSKLTSQGPVYKIIKSFKAIDF